MVMGEDLNGIWMEISFSITINIVNVIIIVNVIVIVIVIIIVIVIFATDLLAYKVMYLY